MTIYQVEACPRLTVREFELVPSMVRVSIGCELFDPLRTKIVQVRLDEQVRDAVYLRSIDWPVQMR